MGMMSSLLITFLLSISGSLLIVKTFHHWIQKRIVLSRDETLFIPFTLILVSFFVFLCRKNHAALIFCLMGTELFAFFVPLFVEIWRRRQFEQNLLMGLDSLLMSLRSGHSFSEALADICRDSRAKNAGFYFVEICRLVHSKQERAPLSPSELIQTVFLEFLTLSRTSHRVVERLKSFRHSLALQFKIQRKSKAATLQARGQSFVMVVLFSGALVHLFGQERLQELQGILIPAILLFSVGTFWVHRLGGAIKWKV